MHDITEDVPFTKKKLKHQNKKHIVNHRSHLRRSCQRAEICRRRLLRLIKRRDATIHYSSQIAIEYSDRCCV